MGFKRFLSFSLIFALVISMVTFGAVSGVAAEENVNLTILATSDIHGHIYPWDYDQAKPAEFGLAKVYTIVKSVRAENPNTILVDNGDLIQGTPLVSYYNSQILNGNKDFTYPMIDVMNMMGYDSMTLGNHEFNFGLDVLNKVISDAKFPILSGNIYKEDGTNFVKPYTIKEIGGVKVGILGLTTKTIPSWENPDNYKGLKFNDIVEEGKKWAKVLKDDEKVDVILAVVHSGIESPADIIPENQIKALAEGVPEINVIVAGHAHSNIPNQVINGVTITEPGKWGENVSRIDVQLTKNGTGYKVANITSNTISTKGVEAAQEVLDLAKPYHDQTLSYVNTKIGVATDDFAPVDEIKGIPTAQIKDTALIDLVQKVQMHYGKADVSMAAMFNPNGVIKKGDITIRDISGLYVYENYLYTIEVTGKQLKDLMEWSAKFYNQYRPGDVTISFNKDIPGYNYDMFEGVDYKIDISKPAGERIIDLKFQGKPVTDDMVLKLAINNYRFNGGGGFMKAAGITNPKVLFDSQKEMGDNGQIRNLIISYIDEKGTISPEVNNNWEVVGANLDSWARPYVVDLVNKGVMDTGKNNSIAINVNDQVTRGEFVKTLVKAMGYQIPAVESTKFTDVNKDMAPYVEAALKNGVTNGISDTAFGTNMNITREQAFSMLMKALDLKDNGEGLKSFKDADRVSEWAKGYISSAVALGIVKGSDGNLNPASNITRGEMASLIDNFIKNIKPVTLLSINDFHGQLKESGNNIGIAKMAGYLKSKKALNPDRTFILSAGDNYQGSAESNLLYGKPVNEAMNMIGFEASAIGNHEFDWGIDKLKGWIDTAKFPFLAANIYDKATGKPVTWAKPYTIIEKDGIKIGIIGISTPETAYKTKPDIVAPYEFKDPVEVTKEFTKVLKDNGADIVVVLSHLGADQDKEGNITGEGADLASAVNVDAIITSHTHKTVAGKINGIPVVQAYYNGRSVGEITLYYYVPLKKVVASTVKVNGNLSKEAITPDKDVASMLDDYLKAVEPLLNDIIGKTEVDLEHDKGHLSLLGEWTADVMREASGAQIAFQNGGGVRTSIPKGDITVGKMYEVMPFDNTLYTFDMTGAQVKEVLEHGIMNTNVGWIQFSGVTVKYDSTKPEGERVVEMTLSDGTPVEMDKIYKVVTNDFMATGGDNYVTFTKAQNGKDTGIPVRDAMIKAVRDLTSQGKTLSPDYEERLIDISKVVSLKTPVFTGVFFMSKKHIALVSYLWYNS
ncbi:MAG: 5'-nucleotidase C-terminal domain-containing protein [Thermoanaerobacteraceae bacterium]|nr:5'-nucleotidase C-terminal domain-containing protein [Thermoanaerobacteraceae bacterium]